jgi:mannose-6-phosphate isomerase-like protein (cupin superfamily)
MTSRAYRSAAAVAFVAMTACHGPQRTPVQPSKPAAPHMDAPALGDPTALRPYLDAYPLGQLGSRTDLLAATAQRSMHLVQTRRGTGRVYRPTRTETLYVLIGKGICEIGDKSYPVAPGATFKIAPNVVHSLTAAEGAVVVAVAYFEPPLVDADDRVFVQ